MHVAADEYSRCAVAEALPNERADTTAAVQALGVGAERILTDNGGS